MFLHNEIWPLAIATGRRAIRSRWSNTSLVLNRFSCNALVEDINKSFRPENQRQIISHCTSREGSYTRRIGNRATAAAEGSKSLLLLTTIVITILEIRLHSVDMTYTTSIQCNESISTRGILIFKRIRWISKEREREDGTEAENYL